jgi:predicted nucleic acid-binding protein
MARDALHAAVVMSGGFDALCSYDRDFDRIAGLVRRDPAEY